MASLVYDDMMLITGPSEFTFCPVYVIYVVSKVMKALRLLLEKLVLELSM